MKRYLRHSLPDYILCLMMTVGLAINLFQGFYLPEAMSAGVLRLTITVGVLDVLLFLAAYNRRTVLAGVFAGVLLAVGALAVLNVLGIPLTETPDAEANIGLWYLITVAAALLVFLLTRTPGGTAVLFLGGMLGSAFLALMEYTCYLWGLLLFLGACSVTYLYKRYRKNVLHTSTAVNAFAPVLAYASMMTAAAMLIGVGLWWCVIRPLDPPVYNITLMTKLASVQVLEKVGVAAPKEAVDTDALSQNVDEDFVRLSSQTGIDEESIPDKVPNQAAEGSDLDENADHGSNPESQPDDSIQAKQINYDRTWSRYLGAVLGVLAVLLAAGVIVLFALRRKLWRRRMERLPAVERTIRFYQWYRKKFRVLGMQPSGTETPYEYAKRVQDRTRFLDSEGATWMDVTQLFVKACYAGKTMTEEDMAVLDRFYRGFYPGCRRMLGGKYLYKNFLL